MAERVIKNAYDKAENGYERRNSICKIQKPFSDFFHIVIHLLFLWISPLFDGNEKQNTVAGNAAEN